MLSYSEPIPMGIDLSGSSFLENYNVLCEDPVLCAVVNVHNPENTQKIIAYFTGEADTP